MKVLYSQIKELVPGLGADAKEVGEVLTVTGFMLDGFEEVAYRGEKDYLLSLEVRENRGDCLSVIGLAREVAAYWGLKCQLPKAEIVLPKKPAKDIEIKTEAGKYVKRILAAKITNLENKESPAWLKEYLKLYEINSINLLVDLSNYVMLLTGYPSHLLDRDKMQGKLFWAMNDKFREITTLDGTRINLRRDEEMILKDDKQILALAGMVGGQKAALGLGTKNIVAEMAIYDHATVRKNVRDLKVFTEAGNRLGKDLDLESMEYAFRLLLTLLLKHGKGKLEDEIFSYYPKKRTLPKIKMGLDKPQAYAGIEISAKKVVQSLKDLRFGVTKKGKKVFVTPPKDRTDIELMEDVVEEVVRMADFRKIPVDEVPALEVVKNITPKVIFLAEEVRDILTTLGYDEVLTLPLVKNGLNKKCNYRNWKEIRTQNSVNEEYACLRQSMAAGLRQQWKEYRKKAIREGGIFEMGKVFGEVSKKYKEHEAWGMLAAEKSLPDFRKKLERVLLTLGFGKIKYQAAGKTPQIANPDSCWNLLLEGKQVGIIYKLKEEDNLYFAEINLSGAAKRLARISLKPAAELTQKIVRLDANVELKKGRGVMEKYLKTIRGKIPTKNTWSLEVVDVYPLKEKVRYTIRVAYKELKDPEAKELHRKVFGL